MRNFVTILFFSLFASHIYAQWQLNGVAVCDTTGYQHIAVNGILSDGEGGAFVVWGDNRAGWDIYAQRVDSSGKMLWANQGIPICTAVNWQYAPVVAPDGEGGFVAAWGDMRNDERDVYAQRVDKDGNILWIEDGIQVVHAEHFQGVEDILLTSDSCFIICWTDGRLFPDTGFVYAQKLTQRGQKLWDLTGIKVSNHPWGNSRLVSDLKGGAYVIWASSQNKNLVAQHLGPDGEYLWPDSGIIASIDNASEGNSELSVCSDGYGGAFLAWDFDDDDNSYIQYIDSIGNRKWGDSGIRIGMYGVHQTAPRIKLLDTSTVICVWRESPNTNFNICDFNGSFHFPNPGIKINNYISGFRANMIIDKNYDIIINNFNLTTEQPNRFKPYTHKFDREGHLYWNLDGSKLSDEEIDPSQLRGFIVTDYSGGALIAWDDDRNDAHTRTDIYIQRVYANGKVGGDTTTSINYNNPIVPMKINLKIYPNPFNSSTIFRYASPWDGFVKVEIYNSLGQCVRLFERTHFLKGTNELIWNGQNDTGNIVPSGIYFIRFTAESAENKTQRFEGFSKVIFLK